MGEAIRIVSGATSGGAYLVVKPEITSAAQLKGKTLATPQLGNTQDVALRAWLKSQGLSSDPQGGGDVAILPQANAQTLDTFKSGDIDGAWVPEPWATRLVQEGGGKVLVDERDLWPDGQYVTTHLVVTRSSCEAHPDVVKALLVGVLAGDRLRQRRARRGAAGGQRRHQGRDRESPARGRPGGRLAEPDLHGRPHRLVVDVVSAGGDRARAPRARPT